MCKSLFQWSPVPKRSYAIKKMSESQTKAGNQEKLKKFENLKNLKFLKI